MAEVYEFRPLIVKREVRRYADGKWIPDDGEYDLAFIGYDGAPFCEHVFSRCRENILWSWLRGHWTSSVQRHPRQNPWHYMLKDGAEDWGDIKADYRNSANERAGDSGMNRMASEHGCCNGRGPEFHIGDPYIKAGLLREVGTKKIVTFPEKFICMYCGELEVDK